MCAQVAVQAVGVQDAVPAVYAQDAVGRRCAPGPSLTAAFAEAVLVRNGVRRSRPKSAPLHAALVALDRSSPEFTDQDC